jgi:hypothetical protein
MDEQATVTVFRFRFTTLGKVVSPKHMWGTPEAIAALCDCTPTGEVREVPAPLLDAAGFYYEHTPTVFLDIQEPAREAVAA